MNINVTDLKASYSKLAVAQNNEIARLKKDLKFCYDNSNATVIELEQINSLNTSGIRAEDFSKIESELSICYTHGNATAIELEQLKGLNITGINAAEFLACKTELNACETGELGKLLEVQSTKSDSWCKGYGYASDYLLCPTENSLNYLQQNIWQPMPVEVKYTVVIVVVSAGVLAAGYGIYSYFNPAVHIVENVVIAAPEDAATNAAAAARLQEFTAAMNAANEQVAGTGIKKHMVHIITNLYQPEHVIEYIQGVNGQRPVLVNHINNLQAVHDYLIHYGGDQAAVVLGNIANAAVDA